MRQDRLLRSINDRLGALLGVDDAGEDVEAPGTDWLADLLDVGEIEAEEERERKARTIDLDLLREEIDG